MNTVTHSHWFRTESQEVDSVLQDQPDDVGIAVWGQFEVDFYTFWMLRSLELLLRRSPRVSSSAVMLLSVREQLGTSGAKPVARRGPKHFFLGRPNDAE